MGGPSNGSQVISLPQGGGALNGIGEKFTPDLHTGTGNFTVPIALPTGRNGFQPQVSFVYSTGTGNGPFGLGWSLSIPGVTRKTSKGIPVYDDSKDVFILSGAEDLVPTPSRPSGATRFRPRTEGLFARIDHYRDQRNDYWEVRSKDGLISTYGTPSAVGQDDAVVSNPANRSHVFAWKLTRTMDPFGNLIEYSYERDAEQIDGPHRWDQLYLSGIRYADYGDPGNRSFLVTVAFTYEDRLDPFSEYRAGFEIRAIKRCKQIEVFTHPATDILVRTYHLHYLDERGLSSDQLPLNGISLLDQITVEGHDGSKSESLPPLEFGYTRFEPTKRSFQEVTGAEMPPASLANPDYELVDLMGSGLPDILETNGGVRYWRNRGNGQFDLPRPMNAAPAGIRLSDKGVQLIDADGDGRTDLLISTETMNGYYPSRFGAIWDSRSFQRYRKAPSFDLKDPEVRLVDLDGDGVTDAIRSGNRLECFFNDPKQGWNDTRFVERLALDVFPNVSFSDPRVKWADMTGDGLQDTVLVHDGLVEYWPSLGRGDWGKRILMRNSPRFPEGYDPKRILLGDVDGDGAADLVYVEDTKVTLWINQSGNRWSDPITIHGTPPVSDTDALRLTDLLGNGVGGVLWSAEASGLSRANMFFLDFTGGTKPYVLNEMDNHMGALTRVAYAPSTRFYLQDEKRLETQWKTPLPFPVQVVARVEVIDSISRGKLTTEYSYHHGYWDGAEREFRGFGRTDQRDTEIFTDYHSTGLHPSDRPFNPVEPQQFSPPTETRTWFHQGPVGDEFGDWGETDFSTEYWSGDQQVLPRPAPVANLLKTLPRRARRDALRTLRGHILRTELYALDGSPLEGRPYTITEHLFGIREESPPGPDEKSRLHIFFPHPLADRTTQWERGKEPMTSFKFTEEYDEYGQPRSQISIGVPRGRDFNLISGPGEPYLATHTTTDYAQRDDAQVYITDRVARTTSYEIINDGSRAIFDLRDSVENGVPNSLILGQTLSFYDGAAFEGLPFLAADRGQVGDYGALVRTESLALTEEILRDAYSNGGAFVPPPYLEVSGPPAWTAEYPQEFQDLVPVGQGLDPTRPGLGITPVGYGFASGGGNSPFARGYFAPSERLRYDFHDSPLGGGRGAVTAKRDALSRDVTIAYDAYDLLPTLVTDAVGLRTWAEHDYRVLQPRQVTDPNGNRAAYTFTPLGLLESKAVLGKADESVGDTSETPSTRLVYDLLAFSERQEPISVRTIRRVHHVNETDVPLAQRDETIESFDYSDGFGRLLQTRTQAEDIAFGDAIFGDIGLPSDQSLPVEDVIGRQRAGTDPPRVVVNGSQVYDNKGRVVEKYEPFFSSGWDFSPPKYAESGQKLTMYYDPRGHVVRTVNPDASEQRVIYGIPGDLTNPDQFTPTPWETYSYDANDNAGRTHFTDGLVLQYSYHWNTPSNVVVDALGRMIQNLGRNRKKLADGSFSAIEEFRVKSAYDIRGNLLKITDQLNRVTFRHVYDLSNRKLRVENFDAGIRRSVLDAAGNTVEQRSSNGAVILHSYDLLNRPIRLWARDEGGSSVTLREVIEYGDGGDPNQTPNARDASRQANLLGRPVGHYDEAGLMDFPSYDFKGNLLEKSRQVINDARILSVFAQAPSKNWQVQAYRVDWEPPPGTTLQAQAGNVLDPAVYEISTTYDALNRVKSALYPQDVDGARKELRPYYNPAGALEKIELDTATYVERIVYNAKGQRTLIAYGNGVMTRHAYDAKTFRLARMRSDLYTTPTPLTYHQSGVALQDYAYAYDLVGNILGITDRTPGCGVLNNPGSVQVTDPQLARLLVAGDALWRRFEYDPLYRLLSATGRECKDIPSPRPWSDDPRCGFNSDNQGTPNQDNATNLTWVYKEEYDYDPAGNMLLLRHSTNGGAWTRRFGMGGLTPQQWNQQWSANFNVGGGMAQSARESAHARWRQ